MDAELRDTVDHAAIRRLHEQYADVVNRRAWAELHDLFLPDATARIDKRDGDPIELSGPEAVGAFIGGAIEQYDFFEFVVLNARVFLRADGTDKARARVYMQEVRHERACGRWSTAYGLYLDRYTRGNAGWRFASRRYHSLARTAAAGSGRDLDVFEHPPVD